MGTAVMGHVTRLGIDSASPVTKEFEFISCDIGKRGSLVVNDGIRGSRSRRAESVNDGTYTVGGTLVIEPRPDDLVLLLPWILGAAASGTTFALAETLPVRYITVDKGSKVYTYDGCKVNRATFASRAGGNLQLTLDVVGLTETEGNSGTFPSIAASLSSLQPYIHHQAALTVASVARAWPSVNIVIDNGLVVDRHLMSQALVSIPEGDRVITVAGESPFTSDETALYALALAGGAGTVVYTNGAYSVTFTFGNLKKPIESPRIGGRNQEVMFPCNFQAFKTGSTDELVVTNDSTP